MSGGGSTTDSRIGLEIGDYAVTDMIAAGGMGAVYRATHPPSGMLKVVKFILAEFVANPQVRERFERECRAAVRLKGHTNIVDIDSYGQRGGEMYLVMEYLKGETLEQHLRRCGPISKQHAFRLIAQIINALHALHEAGIVHRDLKPGNVYIVATDQEAYRIKLIDFGIVHDRTAVASAPQMTKRGAIVGTPHYMALEQYGNAGNVTPAADVFALGVMIWEMFTGQTPWWSAPNEYELHERQKSDRPVLPPGHRLPDGWESIVRLTLSPRATDRPPLHMLLYALAREIPPEPPAPSGFEMIMRYAPKVLQSTPVEVETVRAVDAHRAAGAYWAMQRSTQSGGGAAIANTPWVPSDGIPLTDPEPRAPHSAATVNARPMIAATPPPTTLSGATGASVVPSTSTHGDAAPRKPLLVALGVAATVGLVTFGIAMGLSRRGSNDPPRSDPPVVTPSAQPARSVEPPPIAPDASSTTTAAELIDAGVDAAETSAASTAPRPVTPSGSKPSPRPAGARRSSAAIDAGVTEPPRGVLDPDDVPE